jgi:hypothetical protein
MPLQLRSRQERPEAQQALPRQKQDVTRHSKNSRRYRDRLRRGVFVLGVDADEYLINLLIKGNSLSPQDRDDRQKQRLALNQMLREAARSNFPTALSGNHRVW